MNPDIAAPGAIVRRFSPWFRIIALCFLVIAVITVFMTIESRGNWDFVLPFRGRKILAMSVVGTAIAVSTVVFQTITGNRILTPAIMGFDAMYMLIQTIGVFILGGAQILQTDPKQRFMIDVVLMTAFSIVLFWWLFIRSNRSLHLLVLIGIVFGILFRSITNLLQRMIDPTDFAVLQDTGFASFNSVDPTLLGLSSGIVIVVLVVIGLRNRTLDAMLLGRSSAISIGVNHQREVMIALTITTVLVSVSTALVGPITFFGLLVAHLAYEVMGTSVHRFTIPAAALFATLFLVTGQLVLERVFEFNSSLSVMIEFAGGVLFILLLLKGGSK